MLGCAVCREKGWEGHMVATRVMLVATALIALGMALPAFGSDITAPTISSVVATPPMVAKYDTVHVAVVATDDVGVTGVVADAVALENTSGNTWEGDIPVNSALGSHNITVIARDAADNSSQDTSGSYTTVEVCGTSNDSLRESVAVPASSQYLFKVWGRAAYIDENTFQVNDGGVYSTRVISPGHGICNDDFVTVRGVLDATVPPAKLSDVKYLIVEAAPRQQMTIADETVGKDLRDQHTGTLPYPVPLGTTLPITIMSSDPEKVLLCKTAGGTGTDSIVVYAQPGSTAIPTFYIDGLESSGEVDVVATAPGCLGKTFKVTLAPSGFVIYDPGNFETTSFSTNRELDIRPARLHPTTLAYQTWQRLRGGITASVPVTSSDPAVGTITTSPIVFANGAGSLSAYFDPIGPGTSTVSVGVPAGFSTPTSRQQVTATVTASDVLGGAENVGLDLQTTSVVHLEAAPPSPVDVTVTVTDPSKATVTIDPVLEGTASITFTNVSDTNSKTFYVQGREVGSTTMTLSAPGYNSKSYTITISPSGFCIYNRSFINTTSFSANTTLQIRPCRLSATTLAYSSFQNLRGGKTVDVQVTSSDEAVGVITPGTITFTSNSYNVDVEFDPVGPGNTTVTVVPPDGFSTPSTQGQLPATVTAADVLSGNETVGVDLQTSGSVHLEAVPPSPVDVTVTVADPTKAILSTSNTAEGSASVTFTGVSNTNNKTFYVQGRALGATTITCSAPGYNSRTYTVTVDPSGFYIDIPSADFRTTVYSTNTSVRVRSARLDASTLAFAANQPVRGGKSVDVTVTSSDPAVGTITTSPITFSSNVSLIDTYFDPAALGVSTVALVTPAGFSTPSDDTQRIATVETSGINAQDETVGRDLRTSSNVSLEAAPPSPVDITVTVSDPSKATITTDPAVEGTGSITFTNVSNTSSKSFYVQGRGIGTTSITASAAGYVTSNKMVTIDPSGFVIYSPGAITTTVAAANTNVQIRGARLDPSTFAYSLYQNVRGGLSVDVSVLSSDTSVGVITTSPVTFGSNVGYVTTAFDPIAVGTTAVSAEPPAGFSTSTTKRVINATVNP